MSVLAASFLDWLSELKTVYFLAFFDDNLDLTLCLIFKIVDQNLSCDCTNCDCVAIIAERNRTQRYWDVFLLWMYSFHVLGSSYIEELDTAVHSTRAKQEIVNW